MSKQFSNTTEYSGLIQGCEEWLFGGHYGSISDNQIMLKRFTTLLNYGLDETTTEIMRVDNSWQWEDSNSTEIAIGKTNLADNERNYRLDTTHLAISGVEILDSEGNFYPITEIDFRNIRNAGMSESEFMDTKGRPLYYKVTGDILTLYPAPDITQVTPTLGLKLIHKKPSEYFVSTDTTKTPGFAVTFHDLPELYACAKYAKQNSMTEKAREIDAEIEKRKKLLTDHYSRRQIDAVKKITYKHRNPK